jgi:hypothetical protein
LAQFDGRDVAPLQLVSIDDVEMLEVAAEGGVDILALLRGKVANPMHRKMPLNQYIHMRDGPVPDGHGSGYAAQYQDSMRRMKALVWHLAGHDGAPPTDAEDE